MEDVYTIKVKTKPDTRNLYPSERRYSASTVSGLAWVHIALAAMSFLLACLAVVKQSAENVQLTVNATEVNLDNNNILVNISLDLDENATESSSGVNNNNDNGYVLVVATCLLTVFALLAGLASVLASVRWYVDRNITWVLIMSVFSTIFSFVCFIMVFVWFITSTEEKDELSEIYKDIPFEHYFIAKHSDVIVKNDSHLVIGRNNTNQFKDNHSNLFTKRVLSVNILIAAFLEFLWSILSIKIAYKGMKNNYKDGVERPGNCVEVVTKIKGNDARNRPRDRMLPPKPDLIDHYPNKKIKRIFLSQDDTGFYLKNENDKSKKNNTETSSEFYKERMMNFLNGCTNEEGSRSDIRTPSVQSELASNISPEKNIQESPHKAPFTPMREMGPVSWGDTPEHTIYNQNNINFDRIFKFGPRKDESKIEEGLEASEIVDKN